MAVILPTGAANEAIPENGMAAFARARAKHYRESGNLVA